MSLPKDEPIVPPFPADPQGRIHLLVGPVGAGKSTLAADLARTHRALQLELDRWMATLFRPDRPATDLIAWYRHRARRCVELIGDLALAELAWGRSVVLEVGLLRREERTAFLARLPRERVTVHVVDAPRGVRHERVRRRNEERGPTFRMVVSDAVFELASDQWEPVGDEVEGCAVVIHS